MLNESTDEHKKLKTPPIYVLSNALETSKYSNLAIREYMKGMGRVGENKTVAMEVNKRAEMT